MKNLLVIRFVVDNGLSKAKVAVQVSDEEDGTIIKK
jgi:hypothetical protein